MAKLFPTIEQVDKMRVKPTDGEYKLLRFLDELLDDTYEIYFQPLINGDIPDRILLRQNSGAMTIEIKDWDLIYRTENKLPIELNQF